MEKQQNTSDGPLPLIVEQYKQLHEMRREYNRFTFQAPSIMVGLIVALVAVLFRGNTPPDFMNRSQMLEFAVVFFSVGAFVLVFAYWASRSRRLLRATEDSLRQMESSHQLAQVRMYPQELSADMMKWERFSSTKMIARSVFIFGVLLVGGAVFFAYWGVFNLQFVP